MPSFCQGRVMLRMEKKFKLEQILLKNVSFKLIVCILDQTFILGTFN